MILLPSDQIADAFFNYALKPLLAEDDESNKESDFSRGLKFDRTVPLAAYIARHLNDLTFPFARYQMDMVFRGERAKKGRYRQFRQCDIDVVGRSKLDLLYDAQMPAIIAEIFSAIDIGRFLIRINNRKILTGFFKAIGVAKDEIKNCLTIIDNLEKIGENKTKKALEEIGINNATAIIDFIKLKGDPAEILTSLENKANNLPENETLITGIAELKYVIKALENFEVKADNYCIDLSIARGLDYYTGTVYETSLVGYENLGSICSGGRYEDLVDTFVGEKMPGVGISIGLTRLMSKLLEPMSPNPAKIAILNLDNDLIPIYLKIAQQLRRSGINVFSKFASQKIGKQLQQIDKLGIPLCLLIGKNEYNKDRCSIKILQTGEQIDLTLENLIKKVK